MIYHELGTHNQQGQRSTYLQIRTKPTQNTHWFSWKFTHNPALCIPNKGLLDFKPYTKQPNRWRLRFGHIFDKLHPCARFNLQIHQFHISFLLTKETVVKLLGWFWETAKFFQTNQSRVFDWIASKECRASVITKEATSYKPFTNHWNPSYLNEINSFWRLKFAQFENSLPQSQFESLSRLAPWETHPKTNKTAPSRFEMLWIWQDFDSFEGPPPGHFSQNHSFFFLSGYTILAGSWQIDKYRWVLTSCWAWN